MTLLAERPTVMSVVDRNLVLENEVITMTALASFDRQLTTSTSRHARPRGLNRLVMRLSLTALLWARRRADRGMLSPEQHAIRLTQMRELQRREHDAALRAARVR